MPRRHDIRFVEDDWESPTLGAWGLGWEVWLDGMEVSQFTYFQQVGGIECDPVSTELTYGLERLAMYVQGVESIYDLDFNGAAGAGAHDLWRRVHARRARIFGLQFRDRRHRAADPPFRRRRKGMRAPCSSAAWPLPAYDQCLKASHLFNLLDARGAISVTERAAYILRVARPRQRLLRSAGSPAAIHEPAVIPVRLLGYQAEPRLGELLLELLSEEIPARMQRRAIEDLTAAVARQARGGRAPARRASRGYVTPRRLVVIADGISARPSPTAPRSGAARESARRRRRSMASCARRGSPRSSKCEIRDTGRGEFYFAVIQAAGPAVRRGAAGAGQSGNRRAALAEIDALARRARCAGCGR